MLRIVLILFCAFGALSQERKPLDANHWIEKFGLFPIGATFPYIGRGSVIGEKTDSVPPGFEGESRYVASTTQYLLTVNRSQTVFYFPRGFDILHHHAGGLVDFYRIDVASGNFSKLTLGPRGKDGFTYVASPASYTALRLKPRRPSSYALFLLTSIPGHEREDDTLPSRQFLLERYPQHRNIIRRFTSP